MRVSGDDCSARAGIGVSRAIFAPGRCLATSQSDLAVALTAHDAQLEIASANRARTTALVDLFQRDILGLPCRAICSDELITSVLLPPTPFGKGHAYVKVRERASFAFALCSVAALLRLDEGRISAARLIAGSVADRPWRLEEAEQGLIGQSPTAALFDAVARLGVERAEPIRSDAWKCAALQGAINKALRIALSRETGKSFHE